ncbi:MAG: DUF11 domain-containing protein [Caldilineaceae bacterium]|nr:DUF11 domain-containing protein [Caldilineaceae bacterium]
MTHRKLDGSGISVRAGQDSHTLGQIILATNQVDAVSAQEVVHRLQTLGFSPLIANLKGIRRRHQPDYLLDLSHQLTTAESREAEVTFVGAGAFGTIAWRAAAAHGRARAVAWNATFGPADWNLPSLDKPSLLFVDKRASWRRRMVNQLAYWSLKHNSLVDLFTPFGEDEESGINVLAAWLRGDIAQTERMAQPNRLANHLVAGTMALAMSVLPPVMITSQSAVAATDSYVVESAQESSSIFDDGITISAQAVAGDGYQTTRSARAQVALAPRSVQAATTFATSFDDGIVVSADEVKGDDFHIAATGSQRLIDSIGLEWFVNTDITFSTSSSASGAASEASFTSANPVTTLSGGTTSTTLNDAFDGYNSICISLTGAMGPCETGDPDYTLYNQNGPASLECSDRQVVFPPQVMGDLVVSRKVYVPDNDSFARWMNIITNTAASPISLTLATATNMGSDSNTIITNSSSGDTSIELTDTWVATMQNFSGVTSSDPRLGHILQGENAPVPLANINFVNGDDNPYWAYQFELQPGQTFVFLNFATGQNSIAAAESKAAELATLTENARQCMTPTELSQLVNFALTDAGIQKSASPSPALVGQPLTYTIEVSNTTAFTSSNVVITDDLPASVTLSSASVITESGGTPVDCTGSPLSCSIGELAANSTATATIVVIPQAAGIITNTATVASTGDSDPFNNSASAVVQVNLVDVAIDKEVAESSTVVGAPITYTLSAINTGTAAADNVSVTDILPPALVYVSDTPSQGSYNSGTGIWTVGSLGIGAGATLTLVARANALPNAPVVNTATISATGDLTTTNNSASVTSIVQEVPVTGLEVSKRANTIQAQIGDTIIYTYQITNTGNMTLTTISAEDDLLGPVTGLAGTLLPGDTRGTSLTYVAQAADVGTLVNTVVVTGTDTANTVVIDSATVSVAVSEPTNLPEAPQQPDSRLFIPTIKP